MIGGEDDAAVLQREGGVIGRVAGGEDGLERKAVAFDEIALARKFGARSLLATLAATEARAGDGYAGQPEARATRIYSSIWR